MASKDSSVTTIDDAPVVTEAPVSTPMHVTDHGDNFSPDRVELTLHSGEGDIGKQAVFLGINGHGFNIPRDTPVIVPAEVIEILDNAMMTVYENMSGKMQERQVKRFSYNLRPVAEPAPAKAKK